MQYFVLHHQGNAAMSGVNSTILELLFRLLFSSLTNFSNLLIFSGLLPSELLVVSRHAAATLEPKAAASTFSLKLNLTFDEEASLYTVPATKASPAPTTDIFVPFTFRFHVRVSRLATLDATRGNNRA